MILMKGNGSVFMVFVAMGMRVLLMSMCAVVGIFMHLDHPQYKIPDTVRNRLIC